MSVTFVQRGRPPPSANQIQMLLNENSQLLQTIQEYQNKGKVSECLQFQQALHRNLVYLASIADATQNITALLPPPQGIPTNSVAAAGSSGQPLASAEMQNSSMSSGNQFLQPPNNYRPLQRPSVNQQQYRSSAVQSYPQGSHHPQGFTNPTYSIQGQSSLQPNYSSQHTSGNFPSVGNYSTTGTSQYMLQTQGGYTGAPQAPPYSTNFGYVVSQQPNYNPGYGQPGRYCQLSQSAAQVVVYPPNYSANLSNPQGYPSSVTISSPSVSPQPQGGFTKVITGNFGNAASKASPPSMAYLPNNSQNFPPVSQSGQVSVKPSNYQHLGSTSQIASQSGGEFVASSQMNHPDSQIFSPPASNQGASSQGYSLQSFPHQGFSVQQFPSNPTYQQYQRLPNAQAGLSIQGQSTQYANYNYQSASQ